MLKQQNKKKTCCEDRPGGCVAPLASFKYSSHITDDRLKQTPADWSDPDISCHRCKFQRRCKHVIKFSHPQVGLNANSSPSGRGELGLSHLDSEDWKQQKEEAEEEVWHLPLMSRQEGWWFSLVWFVGASCWLRPVLWLWLWSVGLGSRWEWGVAP